MKADPQQLERIVAYLDGELSAEESAQVEQQLASDEQFRQELQSAQRAWSALDELPMPRVRDDFANTTMDLVVETAREDLQRQTLALPVQKRKRNTANGLMIAVTLLLAALAIRVISQNPNRKLLADLPVIENVDIYSEAKSVAFLRELHKNLDQDPVQHSLDQQRLSSQVEEFMLLADRNERATWIDSLDTDEKASLRGKTNRFEQLSPKAQQAMKAMHEEIDTADNREALVQTMYAYQQWLDELPPGERYELRETDATDRAATAARRMRRAAESKTFELSRDQLETLFNEVEPYIQQVVQETTERFQQVASKRNKRDRSRFQELPAHKRKMIVFTFAMHNSPRYFREYLQIVTDSLPPDMQEKFRQLHPGQQQEAAFRWYRKYHHRKNDNRRSDSMNDSELEEFFVEVLSPDEKAELLALPRDEMQRELMRMYQFKRPLDDDQQDDDRRNGPEGRGDRDRDERGEPRWRDRPNLPRGERGPRRFDGPPEGGPPGFGPPPEFGPAPGRRPRDFDNRESDDRDSEDREGPRRRRPDGPPRRDTPPPAPPTADDLPPSAT